MTADKVLPYMHPTLRRRRLASGWAYKGAAAGRNRALTPGQVHYAITLRRQLAERLKREAVSRALANTTPAGLEWSRIAAACRAEVTRMERAARVLARRTRGAQ